VTSRRALAGVGAGAVAAMLGFGGCAKSVFPPGGPLDAIPPRILATSPADSSVRIARNVGVEFLFSEGMDHASVRDAVRIRPPM
jgi:hypothetical protein